MDGVQRKLTESCANKKSSQLQTFCGSILFTTGESQVTDGPGCDLSNQAGGRREDVYASLKIKYSKSKILLSLL